MAPPCRRRLFWSASPRRLSGPGLSRLHRKSHCKTPADASRRPALPYDHRVAATGTATDARRALLQRLIDHAALFPPASMTVADALAEDARLRASDEAWIVNRFVVPATRLGELRDAPLRLTVVLDDGELPPDERIEAVEIPPGRDPRTVVGLAPEVYVEVPFDERQRPTLARIAGLGLRAKLRCGGQAVPSTRALGDAVLSCLDLGIPFKATAGLHHAVRRGRDHGFLNVLAAAAFADARILDEEDPREFAVTSGGFGCGAHSASSDELARVRHDVFVSFGSCSVAEPVEDLRALDVLPV